MKLPYSHVETFSYSALNKAYQAWFASTHAEVKFIVKESGGLSGGTYAYSIEDVELYRADGTLINTNR